MLNCARSQMYTASDIIILLQWVYICMRSPRRSSALTLTRYNKTRHILHLHKFFLIVRKWVSLVSDFLLLSTCALIYICIKVWRCLSRKIWAYNTIMHAWILPWIVLFLVWQLPYCLFNLSLRCWTFRFRKLLNMHCSLSNLLRRVVYMTLSRSVAIHIGLCYVVLNTIRLHFEAVLGSSFYNWHTFSS